MSNLRDIPPPGGVLYKDVKRHVLQALADGEWKPGEAIPSEKKLTERFGVSIGTLRKAIDELVAESLLIRHQGRGTFVATHRRDDHFFRFFKVAHQDGHRGYPTVELESFRKIKADKSVCALLGLEAGARAFQLTNVLSLDERPMMIDEIVLPERLFAGLTEAQLRSRPTTLYNFYQESFGVNVIQTEERLRSVLATEREQALLGVAPGAPLMRIHRVAFTYHRQPVEWRVSTLNTAEHEFIVSQMPKEES
ncbi:GntR family transcriptional regulator [Cupriavidus sp. 2MCAB6]|uniref:GntR family transcriptional regulator n=1 Tax=Cupriavidus TaxID=106589 RepID=UPI0004534609|nr:GntR family transcriptional regulator [Cupriavidus basilensis]MDF3882182.1 GntR family transcriptional regulator [Cupriavidus basilensis]